MHKGELTPWTTNPKPEPYALNDEGTKFWMDDYSTELIQKKGLEYEVMFAETKDGYKTRAIIDKEQGIMFESQQLESIFIHADVFAYLKRSEEK